MTVVEEQAEGTELACNKDMTPNDDPNLEEKIREPEIINKKSSVMNAMKELVCFFSKVMKLHGIIIAKLYVGLTKQKLSMENNNDIKMEGMEIQMRLRKYN